MKSQSCLLIGSLATTCASVAMAHTAPTGPSGTAAGPAAAPAGAYAPVSTSASSPPGAIAPEETQNLGPGGGDTCATATVIAALPFSDAGSTVGFTNDYDEICPFTGSTSPDVVYSYTSPFDQTVEITLCTNSDYDTKLYVYENACVSPSFACNDDWCSTPSFPNPYVSSLTGVPLLAGNTYYIVVDGFAGDAGNYTIDVTSLWCDPDELEEREPVCVDGYVDEFNGGCNSTPTVFLDIECGDRICGEAGTFLFAGDNFRDTDWYELTLVADTTITWTVTPTFDAFIAILEGTCDITILESGTALAGQQFGVSTVAAAGTYYLFVAPDTFTGIPCGAPYTAELSCLPAICEPDEILEGEPECADGYVDEHNGGCNSTPSVFTDVVCGDRICAEAGNFLFPGCAEDLNGNQSVDFADILRIISEWGPCQAGGCPEDLNGNGNVDFADILVVIGKWGPCPASSNYRDTDWYRLVLTAETLVTWTGTATFDLTVAIMDNGGVPGACTLNFLVSDTAVAGATASASTTLPAGTWLLWAGTSAFSGVPCGSPYNVEVICASSTPGACCDPQDGSCSVVPETACLEGGGVFAGTGTTCNDFDGDRIPDVFELDDCTLASGPCFFGTDPFDADTDDDGLNDGDEAYGTLGGLDLPGFGVDPCHKDILVETDWVYAAGQPADRNKLSATQFVRVKNAFAAATTANPDGTTGIELHVDFGQAPYSNGNAIFDGSGLARVDVDSFAFNSGEYFTMKAANFAANRHGYFHYCLMADSYSVGGTYQNSSGLAELPGDDLIVSMGQWTTGNDNFIGNTFMHELGHNLDLRHGGFENRNFKPNYNSIMNYWYQFCGADINLNVIPDDVTDYSRGLNINLDEELLNESIGVTGGGPGIDWNGDGDAFDFIARNINCRLTNTFANSNCGNHQKQPSLCGSFGVCYDSSCDLLQDHDDWANVELNHLLDPDGPGEVVHCTRDGGRTVVR